MGGHPYYYFVAYEEDVGAALQKLRNREFEAGRYNPVIRFLDFPIGPASPAPGKRHSSVQQALEASDADGTRSILDIERIDSTPDFGVAVPYPHDRLNDLYGTDKPSRANVEENMDFFEDLERGQGIYFVVYENGRPSEILFAGYSYD
jgi:hypothetical protein